MTRCAQVWLLHRGVSVIDLPLEAAERRMGMGRGNGLAGDGVDRLQCNSEEGYLPHLARHLLEVVCYVQRIAPAISSNGTPPRLIFFMPVYKESLDQFITTSPSWKEWSSRVYSTSR